MLSPLAPLERRCTFGSICLPLRYCPRLAINATVDLIHISGFFSGIFISVSPAAIGQISPTDKLGARISTFFGVISIATLLGTPIGGAFVKQGTKEEYHNVAIFAVCRFSWGF